MFIIDQIQEKLVTKFFNWLKKPYYWSIIQISGAKTFLLKNPALSQTTSYAFLAPCHNLEKTKDPI